MSSMLSLSSQGMALATAMAAVSGTVILLSFALQKSLPTSQFSVSPPSILRSCISSSEGKKREKKKKKKRVHFAEDVVDPSGRGEDFRKQHRIIYNCSTPSQPPSSPPSKKKNGGGRNRGMPANRVALYNGILRDRVVHRFAYSH